MRIDDIKLRLGEDEARLKKIAEDKMRGHCGYLKILKKSLDARNKSDIRWVYSIEAEKKKPDEKPRELPRTKHPEKCIFVVGSGPAGLFCAIRLIGHGFRPVILERGETVEARVLRIKEFSENKVLDENSNVQFGEGGAGTFSDGKLNTQTKDPLNREVLETFIRFGAPQEIAYLNKPHVGSDRLREVLKNMRAYIQENGGKFLFETRFSDIRIRDQKVYAIDTVNVRTGEKNTFGADALVLAIGHSSRDTFCLLKDRGFALEARKFAVGVRIEHLQAKINLAQYSASHNLLPPADYKLVSHAGARTAFTFCMCPGGYVMPAASERGGVVTNGMSNYARDGINANSALLVQIEKEDYFNGDVLSGVEFQRKLEQSAYRAGGETYAAPIQRAEDFVGGRVSKHFGEVLPTYSAGTAMCDLNRIFPKYVSCSMKAALTDMDRRLKGFADPDALLTGVETRFSSPVRILRGESGECLQCGGVFPCGEGSGYSGGITSSAADGIGTAVKIFEKFA